MKVTIWCECLGPRMRKLDLLQPSGSFKLRGIGLTVKEVRGGEDDFGYLGNASEVTSRAKSSEHHSFCLVI